MRKLIFASLLALVFSGCSFLNKPTTDYGKKVLAQCEVEKKASACAELSEAYSIFGRGGYGVTFNSFKREKYQEMACEYGDADSCRWAAKGYEDEYRYYKRKDDIEKAKLYYKKGCSLKNYDYGKNSTYIKENCYALFKIFNHKDEGYEKYMKETCDAGNGFVCRYLASYYANVDKWSLYESYQKKGCDFEYQESCQELGYYYFQKNNKELAKIYYKKECVLGRKSYSRWDCWRLEGLDSNFAAQETERKKQEKQKEAQKQQKLLIERQKLLGITKPCASDSDKMNGCQAVMSVVRLFYGDFAFFIRNDRGAVRNDIYDIVATYSNGNVTKLEAADKYGTRVKECNIIKSDKQEMIVSCVENGKGYTLSFNRLTGQRTTIRGLQ